MLQNIHHVNNISGTFTINLMSQKIKLHGTHIWAISLYDT